MQTHSARPPVSRVGLLLLAALFALLLVPLAAAPAVACSCVGWTDAEAMAAADVAFAGRVESVTEPRSTVFGSMSSSDPVTATLIVHEVYKGQVHARTQVTTAMDSASCGLDFVADTRYLVFASYGGDGIVSVPADELTANLCGGTRIVDAAAPGLGPATLPLPGTGEAPAVAYPAVGWIAMAGVGGLGLATAGLWARMRSMCRAT